MLPAYHKASAENGTGMFDRMKRQVQSHVTVSKMFMFSQASEELTKQLVVIEVNTVPNGLAELHCVLNCASYSEAKMFEKRKSTNVYSTICNYCVHACYISKTAEKPDVCAEGDNAAHAESG
jgi:hypothetical protein